MYELSSKLQNCSALRKKSALAVCFDNVEVDGGMAGGDFGKDFFHVVPLQAAEAGAYCGQGYFIHLVARGEPQHLLNGLLDIFQARFRPPCKLRA